MEREANRYLESAVASFFVPASQKAPEKTIWHQRAPDDDTVATLLVGTYNLGKPSPADTARTKIAAFDFVCAILEYTRTTVN
jgi:bifunctional polynucleotide phosphatase/kinase